MSAESRFAAACQTTLLQLAAGRVVPRIWERDHTLWSEEPTEIADRLGWLDLPVTMEAELDGLERLAAAAAADGVEDVVLLGMGGSSLGAEALWRVVAAGGDGPRLHTLDTTVPGWVAAVRERIRLERTLFLVASKSGGTTEVMALLARFWEDAAAVLDAPGERFVAITDPGTSLARLAAERGFRATFLNPPDIGGRFSVLSLFGLVAAALVGAEPRRLLASARRAAKECAAEVPAERNPAARLGAFLATGAALGRPLPTLVTSPRLEAFGLWAEQLLAESTGKGGRGILPVAGEPEVAAERYRDDRLFVGLTLAGEEEEVARRLAAVEGAGHPILRLDLADPWDLGYQFFVWELATAVAGHLLGIHPFDQPDVQAAKDRTRELLAEVESGRPLPPVEAADDLVAELADPVPGYLALLCYLPASAALEQAVTELRHAVAARGIATTFGYGPRYLHSTGQLHKGGFPGGLHAIVEAAGDHDLPLPGQPYGFATLARAQAAGDLLALAAARRRVVRLVVPPDGDALHDLARRLESGS